MALATPGGAKPGGSESVGGGTTRPCRIDCVDEFTWIATRAVCGAGPITGLTQAPAKPLLMESFHWSTSHREFPLVKAFVRWMRGRRCQRHVNLDPLAAPPKDPDGITTQV